MVTSSRSVSPGRTIRLKRQSSIPRTARCGRRSLAAWPRRRPWSGPAPRPAARRASPAGRGSGPGRTTRSRLRPSVRRSRRRGVVLDDPVDEQERPAVRDERLDLAGRMDRSRARPGVGRQVGAVGHRVRAVVLRAGPEAASVGLGCGAQPRGGCREERSAADPIEQVRRHPALEETSRCARSARWIGMFVTRPSTTSSSSAARARAIAVVAVGAPDDRACPAASRRTAGPRTRRTGASPSGRRARPGRGSARRCPALGRKS